MPTKRDQIIQAALRQYRSHSISRTTLKDVAEAAGMPLGNLYYYFKSRDELILAMLDECERELERLVVHLAPLTPSAWLHSYFDWLLVNTEERQSPSCPFGSLATELRALGEPAVGRVADIVARYRAAVTAQATALGMSDPDSVFLTVQGAHTVATILGDPALFRSRVEVLRTAVVPE